MQCAVHHSGAQCTHFVYSPDCALCVVLFKRRSHRLPVVVARVAAGGGGQHDTRADRVSTYCSHIAIADALHIIYTCSIFKPFQHRYAASLP